MAKIKQFKYNPQGRSIMEWFLSLDIIVQLVLLFGALFLFICLVYIIKIKYEYKSKNDRLRYNYQDSKDTETHFSQGNGKIRTEISSYLTSDKNLDYEYLITVEEILKNLKKIFRKEQSEHIEIEIMLRETRRKIKDYCIENNNQINTK